MPNAAHLITTLPRHYKLIKTKCQAISELFVDLLRLGSELLATTDFLFTETII